MATTQMIDRPDVGESNGLIDGLSYHAERRGARRVQWDVPGLRVTRLRLLSDPGFPAWDVSYCHGELDGKPVDVELPFSQLPKKRWRRVIVEHAIRDGVNAKRMGILTNVSTLC